MPYIEEAPKSLSGDQLNIIHSASIDLGSEETADLLLNSYWLRRDSSYPLEESTTVCLYLLMYDKDWEHLGEAGVKPLGTNDLGLRNNTSDTGLPVFTNLHLDVLFDTREKLEARLLARAETELEQLEESTEQSVVAAIGKIGLSRVNQLLNLLGVVVDETGSPTYCDIEGAQLEGVRYVVRVMSRVYRDFVRMNPAAAERIDIDAVVGTDIEDPTTKERFASLIGALGVESE